jgi:hypothetical protein
MVPTWLEGWLTKKEEEGHTQEEEKSDRGRVLPLSRDRFTIGKSVKFVEQKSTKISSRPTNILYIHQLTDSHSRRTLVVEFNALCSSGPMNITYVR